MTPRAFYPVGGASLNNYTSRKNQRRPKEALASLQVEERKSRHMELSRKPAPKENSGNWVLEASVVLEPVSGPFPGDEPSNQPNEVQDSTGSGQRS